ncbi:MAG: alpha/beta hydrolase [Oscillospiraceae bacterium]|nr:alpha/beta hydrolase [Oscillospiraceae bacterium]
MKKEKRGNGKMKFVLLCIGVFILSTVCGAASKMISPSWAKQYSVKWSDEVGTLRSDISYGEGEANRFDLYLPKDNSRENYGLVIYLHAGGFTTGDKTDDKDTLAWLCSKGYVAAGINYTLRSEEHPEASVLSQSNEIRAAVPKVIEAAEAAGYHIDKMTMAGGSAGHCLAMIYAYRDGKEAPVPVVLTYGGVGPSNFHREDWSCYGLDKDTDESIIATQMLFSSMLGEMLTEEEIRDGSYLERMHIISASEWVSNNPVPTVVAYGTHDRVQAFPASLRLKAALEENNVDYKYFEFQHSGHGLQNDNAVQKQWMEAVEEYLDKYMPLE